MLLGRVVSWVLLASMAVSSAGCSLIFVKPPPRVDAGTIDTGTRRCTTSKVAPVLDTLFTGLEGARIVYAATASDSVYKDSQPFGRSTDIALGAAFAALFLSSAIYGYVSTAKCSALKQEPSLVVQNPRENAQSPAEGTEKWGGDQSTLAPTPAPSTSGPMPRQ